MTSCISILQVAVLGKGNTFQINASPSEDIYVLVIAGVPLKEAIARHGPFVMNTWEEIEQAFSDFQSGKLGSIAGSEERYAKTQKAVSKQKASGTWNKKQTYLYITMHIKLSQDFLKKCRTHHYLIVLKYGQTV